MKTQRIVQLGVRIKVVKTRRGESLHSALVAAAKENSRSLNAEINARLEESFRTSELITEVRKAIRQEFNNGR